MTIQDKINALIAHYGNKKEVARRIGVDWITIHRWVSGEYKPSKHIEPLINRAYNQIKG